ncbi:DUF2505 domain-containing protein [Saccharopolyspora sp. HNM0983]|uniref:DUF2505 domain-containing protein n=1 Tax=Saccharopolyspora montiporae TaxID=2781240 RepID=A0A929B7W8_9PSEU|nr:DUF2505 domain-containing protein [Saccharopolyspora sp. HNM0983]MBE9374854.1 DUF2505 domain-containing protein [Saccharopolyspora sp. HNM0983]
MARRIEHRSTSAWSAAEVHAALIDLRYLTDRLAEIGGPNAALVQHTPTEDGGVHLQFSQDVPADSLPAVARTVVGDDLAIDRSESWRRVDEGHYTGEIAAEIKGAPCSITGSMWLHDLAEPGPAAVSELVVSGEVRVGVPFIAGKLEDLVAEQVEKLLIAEEAFTDDWLTRRT